MSTAATASGARPPGAVVAGVDLLSRSEPEADHALHELLARLPAAVAAGAHLGTHWGRAGDVPHVALAVELPGLAADEAWALLTQLTADLGGGAVALGERTAGPPELAAAAQAARQAQLDRAGGRLVHYPGVSALVGDLTVAEVLGRSAVDRVRVVATGDAEQGAVLVTRDHVRPAWAAGELVLLAQPARGGTLVPFESPDPTPCCDGHH